MHSLHQEFVARFGINFAQFALGFTKNEIEKLEHQIRCENRKNDSPRLGRPPIAGVRAAIQKVINGERWNVSKSLKALTNEVARELAKGVGSDTVARELDRAFLETDDPRFKRTRRKKR